MFELSQGRSQMSRERVRVLGTDAGGQCQCRCLAFGRPPLGQLLTVSLFLRTLQCETIALHSTTQFCLACLVKKYMMSKKLLGKFYLEMLTCLLICQNLSTDYWLFSACREISLSPSNCIASNEVILFLD